MSVSTTEEKKCCQKHPPEAFYKKGVLQNYAKSTEKHQRQCLFFNKVAGLRPATLLKKRLWHSCFPVNFAKFSRTSFLQNTPGRLLLCSVIQVIEDEGFVNKLLLLFYININFS